MSTLEVVLTCIIVVTNYFWFRLFTGYREGVLEALKDRSLRKLPAKDNTFKVGQTEDYPQ